MEYLTLHNGFKVPVVGMGANTFGKVNHDFYGALDNDTKELIWAYENGYRLIDTAIVYRNETVIAKSIKDAHLNRKDVMVTSKIPTKELSLEDDAKIEAMIQSSINIFGGYVDIYLIHHPSTDEINLKVWKALESHYLKGHFKAIGVSNFSKEQLDYIMKYANIKPMMNQIESNPANWQQELISYCKAYDIVPVAWGPLDPVPNKDILTTIGNHYGKTWAQILLRYQIQKGVVVIPKSHNKLRQFENINIFDFTLSLEDMRKIEE
ncbi:aldo/keto reductase family protein [Acholeplasma laidlawii]|uniref:aldo/keto reductase family protein n=1 Tax=Acholeplasma laidlawii TaxID=2148 RepID=UPI00084C049E|nr:aldo/keto reductase [Acholeplasma laidlawii]OED59662.1 aldo/keto reductase [Acholeplasma laidlawii]